MIKKFIYLYSKIIKKIIVPSVRLSSIDKTAKIGYGSNLINVKIGRYSYMGNFNSVNNAKIGNFCSIASYCSIGGDAHPLDFVSTSPFFYKNEKKFVENHPVSIGNDVWIGEKVFIKSGISIGDGAVIGAHSVVTKDIPNYAIVAGVPAKIISYRFNKDLCQKMENLKWWDFSEDLIRENYSLFQNPQEFIKQFNINEER